MLAMDTVLRDQQYVTDAGGMRLMSSLYSSNTSMFTDWNLEENCHHIHQVLPHHVYPTNIEDGLVSSVGGKHFHSSQLSAVSSTLHTDIVVDDGSTNMETAGCDAKRDLPGRKLPLNAVELVAWGIIDCSTTTPSLAQIAVHIQSRCGPYHCMNLDILQYLVRHHLHANNPDVFLPVHSATGHHSINNPDNEKWAINYQQVSVDQDGIVKRRRVRYHGFQKHTARSGISPYTVPSPLSRCPAIVLPHIVDDSAANHASGHALMSATTPM